MSNKVTAPMLKAMKDRGEKITVLTAYDYPSARLLDEAGMDVALVGDSLGMVIHGFDSTIPVTMDMMVMHAAAVVRGARRALVVSDMPFMSYQISVEDAVRNAGRLMKETGVQAVKIEGGASVVPIVERLVSAGIPVMGHLGMTPQSVNVFGGPKMQGKDEDAALRIEQDALAIQDAGVFAVVLELVPADLAARITEKLEIPTIGIGAGPNCDGQVQVMHDIIGLYDKFVPKHAKQYTKLWGQVLEAYQTYVKEVKEGEFPVKG